jgi:hypothetical protein
MGLMIQKSYEQGKRLPKAFFDNIELQRGVDRESLLLVFDEAMKAMRRYRRLQVLWMSSNICMDDGNILNLLPIDLCSSVAMFI